MGKKKVVKQTTEAILKGKEELDAAFSKASVSKKSYKVERGKIFINATYNNTLITVTDLNGNVLAWTSAGALGFAGPKKATPFAASKVVAAIAEKLKDTGPYNVEVFVKGIGSGRNAALRSLINHEFNIVSIKDDTPIPHNGPRPPKRRRV